MPRRARRAMLLATLAIVACGRGRPRPSPERFVPQGALAAAILPDLGAAATGLAALHRSLAAFPGAEGRAGWRRALEGQLGFDPLEPTALAGAGLDPRGGAALALVTPPDSTPGSRTTAVLFLPVASAAELDGVLSRLARDRLGAGERVEKKERGVATVSFRRPGASDPALSYAIAEQTAIVAADQTGPFLVAFLAGLAPASSLAEDAAWKSARAALGDGAAAIAWVPGHSALLREVPALRDGAALALVPGSGRLTARAAVLLGARAPSYRALAAGGRAEPLVASLDPAAPLVLRWDGDFAALGRLLVPRLPAAEREALARRGVDLERDLFGVLAPGGAAAIALPARLGAGALTSDRARRDPLGSLEAEGIVPVGPDAAASIARLAAALGGKAARRDRGGVLRIRYPASELAWKLDGDRLFVAGGRPGRIDALLARASGAATGWKAPTPTSAAALAGGLGGAVLDVPRLVASVRALPDEAFGGGPSAFVVRSLVDRILEPAAGVAAVSLRAELGEGALVLTLDVEARADSEGGTGAR